jgi:tetratricopeptide (TPR) repeat protein
MLQRILFSILFLFLSSTAVGASNPTLESGINAFQLQKYDDAKQAFLGLLGDPSWRFAALYNLGNVAVRQNHLGEALGFYTRAQHINPHDRDTQDNIKFVLNGLGGRRLVGATTNYDIFRSQILNRFTFGEALGLTLALSLLFLLSLLGMIRARLADGAASPTPRLVGSFIFLVLFTFLTVCKLIDTYSERGVVITDHVDLRSGPAESNASMLEVAEGSEMTIHDTDHDWIQVTPASGGLMGWVPKSALMITSGGGPF